MIASSALAANNCIRVFTDSKGFFVENHLRGEIYDVISVDRLTRLENLRPNLAGILEQRLPNLQRMSKVTAFLEVMVQMSQLSERRSFRQKSYLFFMLDAGIRYARPNLRILKNVLRSDKFNPKYIQPFHLYWGQLE